MDTPADETPGGYPACTSCGGVAYKSHDCVLTGQVPVSSPVWPDCPRHNETYHDADGSPLSLFCNRCGWNREQGLQLNAPNGGWA